MQQSQYTQHILYTTSLILTGHHSQMLVNLDHLLFCMHISRTIAHFEKNSLVTRINDQNRHPNSHIKLGIHLSVSPSRAAPSRLSTLGYVHSALLLALLRQTSEKKM